MKIGYQRKEITIQREITGSLKIHPLVSKLQSLVDDINMSKLLSYKPSLPSLNFKRARSIENAILEVLVICCTWYSPWLPLFLIYVSEYVLLFVTCCLSVKESLRYVAKLWMNYLNLWHHHSIIGLNNIPDTGPGLIVWYHGTLPVDYIGLVANIYHQKNRRVYSVVDRCLEFLPGLCNFRKHMRVGAFSKVKIASLLDEGKLVGVAPGGGRESLFDQNCSVLWNNRTGFAKVANLTRVPIIPVYTENIRLAYKTMSTGYKFWRGMFELTKLPLIPLYGGFPVKLTTHVGSPIFVEQGETPLALQQRVRQEIIKIRDIHQQDIDVMTALEERFTVVNQFSQKTKLILEQNNNKAK